MASKCVCGGNMVKVWDPIEGLWRLRCDSIRHLAPEYEDPIGAAVLGLDDCGPVWKTHHAEGDDDGDS